MDASRSSLCVSPRFFGECDRLPLSLSLFVGCKHQVVMPQRRTGDNATTNEDPLLDNCVSRLRREQGANVPRRKNQRRNKKYEYKTTPKLSHPSHFFCEGSSHNREISGSREERHQLSTPVQTIHIAKPTLELLPNVNGGHGLVVRLGDDRLVNRIAIRHRL